MNDKQIREELIRIDHDYFGDFSDGDWDLWFGAAKEGFMEKFAVMLAERQAALEKVEKLTEAGGDPMQCIDTVLGIARRFTKGGE